MPGIQGNASGWALEFRRKRPSGLNSARWAGKTKFEKPGNTVLVVMIETHWNWKFSLLAVAGLLCSATCPASLFSSGKDAVFVAPSPDMVDVSHGPGMPFGGIGTGFSVFGKYGFVDVYFDGRPLNSSDWRIDRPPQEPPAFAFQLTEGNQSVVLQETSVTWLPNAQPMDKVRAYADLPKGHFVLEKESAHLGLVISGFSPMVPHDLANSTIPVQIFDVTVENRGDQTRSFDLELLHRDPMVVQGNQSLLETTNGETAFACEHGVASPHGVSALLKLAPGNSQTVRFYISWDYPAIRTTSSAARKIYQRYYTRRFHNAGQVIDRGEKIRITATSSFCRI